MKDKRELMLLKLPDLRLKLLDLKLRKTQLKVEKKLNDLKHF
jgi:hypothetical protein